MIEEKWQNVERPRVAEGNYVNMAHAFTPKRKNGRTCKICGLIEAKAIHWNPVVMGHGYDR